MVFLKFFRSAFVENKIYLQVVMNLGGPTQFKERKQRLSLIFFSGSTAVSLFSHSKSLTFEGYKLLML